MTKKLYWENPYLKSFETKIVSLDKNSNWPDKYVIVLEETAFYPEGGGQPWDEGHIGDAKVSYVYMEEEIIYHVIDKPLKEGALVQCRIDWDRRFDFMQQHLGQHILSASFELLYDLDTIGFHLGMDTVTIDLNTEDLEADDFFKVEVEANKQIFKNLSINSIFPTAQQLKQLPLRKQPTTKTNIRIIEVDKYDYSPCGGIHPNTTGEVGIIKILKWERMKGNIRVEFICGLRGFMDYHSKNQQLTSISNLLSIKNIEAYETVERLFKSHKELNKEVGLLNRLLLQYQAKEYHQEAESIKDYKLVVKIFDEKDMKFIQSMASLLNQFSYTIALLAAKNEKAQVVFTRSKDIDIDMNKLFKEVIGLIDGKGGGNPVTAQGGGDNFSNLESLLNAAVIKLKHEYLK